jgi:hypothetical protein
MTSSRTLLTASRLKRTIGIAALAVGAFLLIGTAAAIFVQDAPEYQCTERLDAPEGAVISESSDAVAGEISLWPLGVRCSYFAGENQPRIVVDDNSWAATMSAYGGLALVISGVSILYFPRRRTQQEVFNEEPS